MESGWDGHERRAGESPEELRARLRTLRAAWDARHFKNQSERDDTKAVWACAETTMKRIQLSSAFQLLRHVRGLNAKR